MIKNRFSRLLLAALLMCGFVAPAAAAQYVKVSGAEGKAVYFAVADSPKVTLTTTGLVITAGAQSVEYPLTDYRLFELTDQVPTGITSAVATTTAPVFRLGDAVTASGLQPGTALSVYTTNGTLVGKAQVSEDGSATVGVGAAKGIYIIKTSSKTFKFIKK